MITSNDMYRRAARKVAELEGKVKDGSASEAERARYRAGVDHVLIHEWAEDGRPAAEVLPPLPPEPAEPLDPRVLAFCDWWARVHQSARWFPDSWRVGVLYWWHPHGLETLTWELECDVEEELLRRDEEREQANRGMIVTDLDTERS